MVSIAFPMIHLFIRRANFIDEGKGKRSVSLSTSPPYFLHSANISIQRVQRLRFYRAKQCTMRLRDKMDDELQVNGALGLIH